MAWVNLNELYVPTSRTINGKALSSNVTLGASDIKLSDDTTLQSAWDSISQTLSWTELANGVVYAKYGHLVVVHAMNITLTSQQTRIVATLPEDIRPSYTFPGYTNTSATGSTMADKYSGLIRVCTNGNVELYAFNAANYTGQVVYPI